MILQIKLRIITFLIHFGSHRQRKNQLMDKVVCCTYCRIMYVRTDSNFCGNIRNRKLVIAYWYPQKLLASYSVDGQ